MSKGGAKFFRENKQSAAVLKHGALRRYLAKFAGMVGSTSQGNRVGFIDGYAGSGVYSDPVSGAELPGSPKIALDIATGLRDRVLVPTFIEKGREQFESLEVVVAMSGNGEALALRGDVSKQLGPSLSRFDGLPLLVFLDPFGSSLETDVIVEQIMGRPGNAATEVLLNFSTEALRRMGARVFEASNASGREATLARVDKWLGGVWWRDIFSSYEGVADRADIAAEAVFAEYIRRVNETAKAGSFSTEIRRQPHHKPIFQLTLFMQSSHALMPFNEAISLASEDWRKHLYEQERAVAAAADEAAPRLPGLARVDELDEAFARDEAGLRAEAVSQISESITAALRTRQHLSVKGDFGDVFGAALGAGRETHLREAWKALASQGVVVPPKTGALTKQTIFRAGPPG